MQEAKIVIHYQNSDSHQFSKTPAEAGRAEDVVRCVANLVKKGIVSNISFNSSHMLYKKGKGYTYEVQFMRSGHIKRKRFTVYRLSGSHAKSECYQVTDPQGKYMVVKIPPQPITEVNAYLESVVHERTLAQKLLELGIKVVVPCISSVMKHLHKFDFTTGMTSFEIEEAYMDILRTPDNKFTEHFKIGNSFVFFMEFLDEPFLGKVVREFYHKELLAKIRKAHIERDFIIIHLNDRASFLNELKNIGTKKTIIEIYSGLREMYEAFCFEVDSLLEVYSISIDTLQKRDIFISNITRENFDESFISQISNCNDIENELIKNKFIDLLNQNKRNSESFKKYTEILDKETKWRAFKYSSRKMKMIGNSLLSLLVKLEEIGLVLRDLKVDNLFINDADNMELGVIDLETSGLTESENIDGIVPAGMPGNMTLSNLLFVSQIKRIYGDDKVKEILHIQDWYATIAMMFEAIIGLSLFDNARNYILKINRQIDMRVASSYCEFVRNNPTIEVTPEMIESFFMLSDEEIKGHTWQFWDLARKDLKKKRSEYSLKLKEIKYSLPNALKGKILHDLERKLARIQNDYRNFKLTALSIEYLNKSTTTIEVLKQNLALKEQLFMVKNANHSNTEKKKLKLAIEIDIYKDCIALKQNENSLRSKIYLLSQEHISAFDLFQIMLDHIIEKMSQDDWFQYTNKDKRLANRMEWMEQQSIGPAEGWKSTIIPTKEELAQWARKSRESGFNNLGLYCPSGMQIFEAQRNDCEKTQKKSISRNLNPLFRVKF